QRDPDEGFVAVGRVMAPFGLHGEIKVQSLTDNPERWQPKSRLWFGQRQVTVKSSREAQGHVFLKLVGFPDRTSVEALRHAIIQVPESELPPLPPGEHYRFQLVGLRVEDRDGHALGVVEEVLETGANDVLRVRTPAGGEMLLAALPDVIVSVDVGAGRIVVDPPDWT
ncbi:MAG TPA: ribosome maturation factor RimM, partial [Dehalococcoidia bacterium]|nr:ribosome maturation factor RimM [Dehalococcoidia bacterium]